MAFPRRDMVHVLSGSHLLAVPLALSLTLGGTNGQVGQQPPEPPDDPLAALRAQPIQPGIEKGYEIRVVDTNSRPLTNASVTVYFYDDVPRERAVAFGQRLAKKYSDGVTCLLARLAVFGKRYATDDQGIARIPCSGLGYIVGIRGNRIGLNMTGVGREVVLHPIKKIHVLVEDHEGKPAGGVPVWIRDRVGGGVSGFPRQRTDAKGRATLRVIVFESARGWRVEPRLPLKMVPGVSFDPRTLDSRPERPIRLRLPPCGTVKVYVSDSGGKPIDDLGTVYMAPFRPLRGLIAWRSRSTLTVAATVKDEVATFPFVEVGFDGEVTAVVGGVERGPKLRFDGPRHKGDMRALALEGVTRKPVLSFRAVTGESIPFTTTRVSVILSNSHDCETLNLRTDAQGRVSVPVPDALEEETKAVLTLIRSGGDGDWPNQLAKQLRGVDLRESRSLGDLNLDREPVILAGRLLDPSGRPISGVIVSLAHRYGDARARHVEPDTQPGIVHESKTDDDGRFVFRAVGESERTLDLRVGDRRGNRYPIVDGKRLPSGTKNATVIARVTSTIHGRIRGLGEHGKLPIELRLVPGKKWISLTPGGRISFASCPAGQYRVEIRRVGTTRPLLTVSRIQVVAGVANRDPRLKDIELATVMPWVSISVLGPGDLPLQRVSVRLRIGSKVQTKRYSTGRDGVVRIPVPDKHAEVVIWERFRRYQMRVLQLDKKGMTVTLQPAYRVSITIKNVPILHATQWVGAHIKQDAPPGAAKPWWMGLGGLDPGSLYRSLYSFEDARMTIPVAIPGCHVLHIGRQTFPFATTGAEREKHFVIELDDETVSMLRSHAEKLSEKEKQERKKREKKGR